jgi:GAF domain-containing protein
VGLSVFSPAAHPLDERARQRAVDASNILRAPPDATLHTIVVKAAGLFDAPSAAVSIIDRDRQWFAARVGIPVPETARSISFCAHAILTPAEPLVLPDLAADDRFAGNPFVLNKPSLRFYAGMPVLSREGQPLGTLCVLDDRPRDGALPLDELAMLARRAGRAIDDIRRSGMA